MTSRSSRPVRDARRPPRHRRTTGKLCSCRVFRFFLQKSGTQAVHLDRVVYRYSLANLSSAMRNVSSFLAKQNRTTRWSKPSA